MAVTLQAQLKPFGYEIDIQQVKNIGEQLAQSQEFDAAMYSANMLVTGDPLYIFNQTLVNGGAANYGGCANAELEARLSRWVMPAGSTCCSTGELRGDDIGTRASLKDRGTATWLRHVWRARGRVLRLLDSHRGHPLAG